MCLLLSPGRIWTQTCLNAKSSVTGCLLQCVTALLWANTSSAWPFHFLVLCNLSERLGCRKHEEREARLWQGGSAKDTCLAFLCQSRRRNLCQTAGVKEQEAFLFLYSHVAHQAETVRNALGQKTSLHLLFHIQILFFNIQKNIPSNSAKNPVLINRSPWT